ncbi:MAG: nuclear transport factor 2 family protein [Anaerolineae bacterium]|nr:nuclear transport factor 2 family protein [Anaerolineae bacterium]
MAQEEDIALNFAPDVVLLTCTGIYRGHEGIRQSAEILRKHFPRGTYNYRNKLVEGEVAFLEWTGQSPHGQVKDGTDSFVIRNGRIVARTIHYSVKPDDGEEQN